MADDLERIKKILSDNADKSFVQRILKPKNFPILDNGDGTHSTHSMAWGTDHVGRAVVYPTVMMQPDGTLKRYSEYEAWKRANESGNVIEFDDPEEADWFSRNYKQVWDHKGKK